MTTPLTVLQRFSSFLFDDVSSPVMQSIAQCRNFPQLLSLFTSFSFTHKPAEFSYYLQRCEELLTHYSDFYEVHSFLKKSPHRQITHCIQRHYHVLLELYLEDFTTELNSDSLDTLSLLALLNKFNTLYSYCPAELFPLFSRQYRRLCSTYLPLIDSFGRLECCHDQAPVVFHPLFVTEYRRRLRITPTLLSFSEHHRYCLHPYFQVVGLEEFSFYLSDFLTSPSTVQELEEDYLLLPTSLRTIVSAKVRELATIRNVS